MKIKKMVAKYASLFVFVFAISAGLAITASADFECYDMWCIEFYQPEFGNPGCPQDSPCPGGECWKYFTKRYTGTNNCCQTSFTHYVCS